MFAHSVISSNHNIHFRNSWPTPKSSQKVYMQTIVITKIFLNFIICYVTVFMCLSALKKHRYSIIIGIIRIYKYGSFGS